MKPQELSIGNLVCYNGKVVKVEQITKKKIGYHRHKGETRMNYARLFEIEPIPITDELLLENGMNGIALPTAAAIPAGEAWSKKKKSGTTFIIPDFLGWLMGFEPTTFRTTI